MAKQISLSNEIAAELDRLKGRQSYSVVIAGLLEESRPLENTIKNAFNSIHNRTISALDNKILKLLEKLTLELLKDQETKEGLLKNLIDKFWGGKNPLH